ncbi:MAG TPA: ABC transporter ATP-binding protein [Leucothrix sp.]|nr:ABC transporter ATP-binding protein [Leucothrix sp.]
MPITSQTSTQTSDSTLDKSTPENNTFTWQYLKDIALKHKKELIFANVISVLATLILVPIPLLMPMLVDEVLLDKSGVALTGQTAVFFIIFFTVVTLVLRIVGMVLLVIQTRSFTLIAKDITYHIRKDLLAKVNKISMSEYETLGGGTISSHFVVDVETIDKFIAETVSKFIVGVLLLIGIIAVLLWLHWKLALIIIVLNPIVVMLSIKMGKKVKKLKKKENSAFGIFQQSLTETLDGIQQIRASNRESFFFKRLLKQAKYVRDHSASFSWRSNAASRLSFMTFIMGFDIFRAIAMLVVALSDLSIGEMFAVFGYLWFLLSPIQDILNINIAWFGAKAALTRINTLASLKSEPQYPHEVNPFEGKHTVSVRAEDISFAYGNHRPVLKNVNLSIHEGQKIALVGASGGGKSTFVQVLLGLYQSQQGMIYFDNQPVTRVGLDVVRENVATVLQHPALFNDSVRMNLTLGQDIEEEKLWNALKIAQLEDVVKDLEEGLDTLVGKQGVRLSGGQRQRLAIARMVLSEPKVVILDEATSSLDTETEKKLHQALNDFLKDRTTLIIAHRLSAVRQADHIFVFEDGHIIEQGSHADLIKGDGLYQRLYGE